MRVVLLLCRLCGSLGLGVGGIRVVRLVSEAVCPGPSAFGRVGEKFGCGLQGSGVSTE